MESGPARLTGRAGPLSARMMTTTARRNSHRIGGQCGFRYLPPEPCVCSYASPGLRRQANGPVWPTFAGHLRGSFPSSVASDTLDFSNVN